MIFKAVEQSTKELILRDNNRTIFSLKPPEGQGTPNYIVIVQHEQ